jgi:hypothetical protein
VTQKDTPAIDLAEGFSLAAALIDEGRVAAWLLGEMAGEPEEPQLEWIRTGSIGARLTIDGHPVRCGLVKFELEAPAVGGAVPVSLGASRHTFADPEGRCDIGGLFPGRWRLTLTTHLVNTEGASTAVDVYSGERREVELQATRGRDLPGRVVDAHGLPLGTGTVHVIGLDRATVVEGVFLVRPDGSFTVTGLVEGFGYLLRWDEAPWFRAPNLPPSVYRQNSGVRGRAKEVELRAGIPDLVHVDVSADDDDRGDG